MPRFRRLLLWIIVIDLIATLLFWAGAKLVDQSGKLSGGTGIVFYSDNASEANARIERGLQLLEAGKVSQLVMVGGHRPQEGIVGSQDMALAAIRRSGKGALISADVNSRDTISGIRNAGLTVAGSETGKVIFISNCMHLVRAKTIYRTTRLKGRPKAYAACTKGSWNPAKIWQRAHYEAGAWAVFIMPESWRDGILDMLRGDQGDSGGAAS